MKVGSTSVNNVIKQYGSRELSYMAESAFLLALAAIVYFLYGIECKIAVVNNHGNILAYGTAEGFYLFRLTKLLV